MACAGSRALDLAEIAFHYGYAALHSTAASDDNTAAYNHWVLSEDHDSLLDLIQANSHCITAIQMLAGKMYPFDPESAVPHFLDSHTIGEDGDVTMDAILTAMITADFDQLQKFTGLVDAYRVALWNEPFNADFYAALARGFTP